VIATQARVFFSWAMLASLLSSCASGQQQFSVDRIDVVREWQPVELVDKSLPQSIPNPSVLVTLAGNVDLRRMAEDRTLDVFAAAYICNSSTDATGLNAGPSDIYDGRGALLEGVGRHFQYTDPEAASIQEGNKYHVYVGLFELGSNSPAYDLRRPSQNLCLRIKGEHFILHAPVATELEKIGIPVGQFESDIIFISHERIMQALTDFEGKKPK
jgi:hypothetical protein